MIARAAMWNPAIFAPPPPNGPPPSKITLVHEYLDLVSSVDYAAHLRYHWYKVTITQMRKEKQPIEQMPAYFPHY